MKISRIFKGIGTVLAIGILWAYTPFGVLTYALGYGIVQRFQQGNYTLAVFGIGFFGIFALFTLTFLVDMVRNG